MTQLDRIRRIGAVLMERDRWSRDELLGHQQVRLDDLVRHAVARSPYYRSTLGRDAGQEPVRLADLPTLPKATMIEHFDRIVCDRRATLAAVEQAVATGSPLPHRILSTSGTTGLRGYVLMAEDEFEQWIALHLRVLGNAGIDPQTRVAAIGAPSPLHWSRQLFETLRAGRPGAPSLSVVTPLEQIRAALDTYRPDALLGYPSMMGVLAEEQLAGRLDIEPSIVLCGGEATTADVARRIEDAWSVQPTVVYPTTEAPIVACASQQSDQLEIAEDFSIIEVVDEHDQPVPPGTAGSKVLLTNLVNRVQPLIRYEISDAVTLAHGPNPAGRPYARIATVEGRAADTLELPARAGGTVLVHPVRLGEPLAAVPEVRQFQIVHDRAGLAVLAVLRDPAAAEVLGRVRAGLEATLFDAGAVPPPVRVEPVAALEREPGPGAKLKLVKAVSP
jgi:phenylacetate-CoA ligase